MVFLLPEMPISEMESRDADLVRELDKAYEEFLNAGTELKAQRRTEYLKLLRAFADLVLPH
jgi:hypothetical protein